MKTMTQNWINFATNGDPSPEWTPVGYSEDEIFTFWNISSANPQMTHSEEIKERLKLWDQILVNGSISNRNFQLLLYSIIWTVSVMMCSNLIEILAT